MSTPYSPDSRPVIWGFSQNCSVCNIKTYRNVAEKEFPELSKDDALFKYVVDYRIEDFFFPNSTGDRCCWGKDISYINKKQPNSLNLKRYEIGDRSGRTYYVTKYAPGHRFANTRRGNPTAAALLKHASEDGWALPEDDQHHFLRFPLEIQRMVIGFTIIAQREISPTPVPCNWKRQWQLPELRPETDLGHPIGNHVDGYNASFARNDSDGDYLELKFIIRRVIDATVLRACKHFHLLGTDLLYGGNRFCFSTNIPTLNKSPPSMIPKNRKRMSKKEKRVFSHSDYRFYRPNPKKPEVDGEWMGKVSRAITDVKTKVHLQKLPGWVCYDHFLRQLFNIGPVKAAMMKHVVLEGTVILHDCQGNHLGCDFCGDGLVLSLRHWIPFMASCTPSLQTLTIRASRDSFGPQPHAHSESPLLWVDPTVDALKGVLQENIHQLHSLKDLKIEVGKDGHDFDATRFVDIIEGVKKRRNIRDNIAREAEIAGTASSLTDKNVNLDMALPVIRCSHCRPARGHHHPKCKMTAE